MTIKNVVICQAIVLPTLHPKLYGFAQIPLPFSARIGGAEPLCGYADELQ